MRPVLALLCAVSFLPLSRAEERGTGDVFTVDPLVETDPVTDEGDAADDLCLWLHPGDPSLSLVIGTNKQRGLDVYGLDGSRLSTVPDGRLNNVDIRYNVPLGGELVDLVAAGNRTSDTIEIYRIDLQTRLLHSVRARELPISFNLLGSCLYRSPFTGKLYFFVTSRGGRMQQWELFDNGEGLVDAKLVRSLNLGTMTEGCVADDEYGFLYVGQETVALWKYGAEPDQGEERVMVDSIGPDGHFGDSEVEGLAIYYLPGGTGYLLASNQLRNQFIVYRREGTNEYLATFEIGESDGIDAVQDTDGIDVLNTSMGESFPLGLFVAQDGVNPGANQNFKLVPWERIARGADPPLIVDTTWSPRNPPTPLEPVTKWIAR